ITPTNHAWTGVDSAGPSDTALESPDLMVDATLPFSVTVSASWQFEFSMGTAWDGAVIEVTTDGGTTWDDASMYATVPYGGTLTSMSGNALGGHMALVDQNASYPAA